MRSSESDIKIRKGLAWSAFHKMKSIWRSKIVSIRLKANIFKATCLSILLYGCESWVLTDTLEKSLNAFATNAYRIMLNIKRTDRVSNTKIYQMTKQEPLNRVVQQRQLNFIGHQLRRPKSEPGQRYALYTPHERHGKRRRGKPHQNYAEYIAKLLTRKGEVLLTATEIAEAALDRKGWNEIVVACTRPPAADQ